MENNDKKEIYDFINKFWKFIKGNEIPSQNEDEAWDVVVNNASEVTKEYQGKEPMHKLFRLWMVAYLEYMSTVSKGVPTLMQECKEVVKTV